MKLGITTIKKSFDSDETYREYNEFEIESYRWNENHQFEYTIQNSARWYKLDDNEEITKLY